MKIYLGLELDNLHEHRVFFMAKYPYLLFSFYRVRYKKLKNVGKYIESVLR